MKRRYEDPPEGYCAECSEYVQAILVDFGIGPYEYWGQKCVDTQLEWVSPCCECDINDWPPEEDDNDANSN